MRVVFINCTYETFTPGHSGAICTWIYEVCRAAATEGIEPLVISRRSDHPQFSRRNTIFVDYPFIPEGPIASKLVSLQKHIAGWVRPRQGVYCDRIAEAIKRNADEYSSLVLHNDMELAVSLRRRFPEATILHIAHNNNGSTSRCRKRFASSVDTAIAVSDFAGKWNEKFYRLPRGACKTLYNGVNLNEFRPRQRRSSSQPCISYIGKLDRNKAPDSLLRAAKILAGRTNRFSVRLIGRRFYDRDERDDYIVELESLAAELSKMGVACEFTGWIDRAHVAEVLANADIHVTPSQWEEPFGLTTLEAMACGLAVIGARTGGTPEVIGEAGFLFDHDNERQLADLLEPLVRDEALRRKYGRIARERAELFSWGRTWDTLKEFIGDAESRKTYHNATRSFPRLERSGFAR
ncbi:MAG TPA: glycosyltransferase family 4 protein [Tepidisphaeraceae bacterium]|jgi:glycosyltransferase involved in cell wall biosynthesis|nr:glycosyltransferase family 4 protein [Tepidisphaeraceae bacterium]